jgi:hypothetical protein
MQLGGHWQKDIIGKMIQATSKVQTWLPASWKVIAREIVFVQLLQLDIDV